MRIGLSLLLLFFAAAKANAGIRVVCSLVPGQCAGGPDAELRSMNENFQGIFQEGMQLKQMCADKGDNPSTDALSDIAQAEQRYSNKLQEYLRQQGRAEGRLRAPAGENTPECEQSLRHNRECIKDRESEIRGLNDYGCTAHTN